MRRRLDEEARDDRGRSPRSTGSCRYNGTRARLLRSRTFRAADIVVVVVVVVTRMINIETSPEFVVVLPEWRINHLDGDKQDGESRASRFTINRTSQSRENSQNEGIVRLMVFGIENLRMC